MPQEGKRYFGLKWRWVLNSLLPVIIIVSIAVLAFVIAINAYYYSNIRVSLEQRVQTTSRFFNNYLSLSYSEYYSSTFRYAETFEDKNKLELQFLNSAGRINVSSSGLVAGMSPGTQDIADALELGKTTYWTGADPNTGEKIMSVTGPMYFSESQLVGAVRCVTSLRLVDRQVLIMFMAAIIVGLFIIGFVIMSNTFFIRSIVNPIQEINGIAKKIAKGSYGSKIEKKYNDEIGELSETINEMSVEISNAEKIKNDFIASVSHELRTPLTAISGWGETVMYMDQPEEMRKGVEIMMKESQRLSKLVEELLEFTLMDSGRLKLHMEPTDAAAEFEEIIFVYMETLKKQDMVLEYSPGDFLPEIMGDRERLKQVFFNILDNAAKHGAGGSKIMAASGFDGEYLNLIVRDFGPGIPEEDLPYVKQKFYKGASQARGSGIGLAVANEIVIMHDGELIIENADGGGTEVTIRLPLGISAQPTPSQADPIPPDAAF